MEYPDDVNESLVGVDGTAGGDTEMAGSAVADVDVAGCPRGRVHRLHAGVARGHRAGQSGDRAVSASAPQQQRAPGGPPRLG